MIQQTRILLIGVLILLSRASQAQITSTFYTDADGTHWQVVEVLSPVK